MTRGWGTEIMNRMLVVLFVSGLSGVNGWRNKRSATDCPPKIVQQTKSDFNAFLTVNAEADVNWAGQTEKRLIEINWTLPPDTQWGDWVGLFRKDPTYNNENPLVRVRALQRGGYVKTKYKFPDNPFLGIDSPRSTCLYGFWIGYIRGNETLLSNCLRIHPQWMKEDRDIIGDMPIHSLMIPGTHNSGAYDKFDSYTSDNIWKRWSVNQGEDVWNQLLYGIRYLDLRVGYYPNTPEKFWSVHDFVKMNPLYEILQDVRRFLKATDEILIVDFHRFPKGFEDGQAHQKLIRYLKEELGEFMAPDWLGRWVTPNDLWHMNRSLIVTYSHFPSSLYDDLLWTGVHHAWGDESDGEGLREYLDDAMYRRRSASYLWSAMTHLTPSTLDVLLKPNSGFRELSDDIAKDVTKWYRDDWWDVANIVATDFFLGNNVIEESIKANRRRKICRNY